MIDIGSPYLTTLDEDVWCIDDGEVANRANPDSYEIPSSDERSSIMVGMIVKIRFYIRVEDEAGDIEDCGERMWVEVTRVLDSWYHGRLDNQPSCTDGISPGMPVWFQPRHIIAIYREPSCIA